MVQKPVQLTELVHDATKLASKDLGMGIGAFVTKCLSKNPYFKKRFAEITKNKKGGENRE